MNMKRILLPILVVGSLLQAACIPQEAPPAVPESEVIKITARQLYSEYKINEVAADLKYKGKVLEVTGVIEEIVKDLWDNPTVIFETDAFLGSVHATFSEVHEPLLAKLVPGETFAVRGVCEGFLTFSVSLGDCEPVR